MAGRYQPINDERVVEMKSSSLSSSSPSHAPLYPILQPAIPIAYPSYSQPPINYIPPNHNNNNNNNNNAPYPSAIPVAPPAEGGAGGGGGMGGGGGGGHGNNAAMGYDEGQGLISDIPSIDQLEWIAKRRHVAFDVRDILGHSYRLVQYNCFSSLLLILFILFIIGLLIAVFLAIGLSTIIHDFERHHNTTFIVDNYSATTFVSHQNNPSNNQLFYQNNNNIGNIKPHSMLPALNAFFPTAGLMAHIVPHYSFVALSHNTPGSPVHDPDHHHRDRDHRRDHHRHRDPDRMRDGMSYRDKDDNTEWDPEDAREVIVLLVIFFIVLLLLSIFVFIPFHASIQYAIITAIQKNSYIHFSDWFTFLFSNQYRPFLWFSFSWLLINALISAVLNHFSFIVTFFFMFCFPLRLQYPSLPVTKCIKFSFYAVKNHFCQLIILYLACWFIQIIGFLMCGVGLFLTIPMAVAAPIFAYHAIFGIHSMRVPHQQQPIPAAEVIQPYQYHQYAAIPVQASAPINHSVPQQQV